MQEIICLRQQRPVRSAPIAPPRLVHFHISGMQPFNLRPRSSHTKRCRGHPAGRGLSLCLFYLVSHKSHEDKNDDSTRYDFSGSCRVARQSALLAGGAVCKALSGAQSLPYLAMPTPKGNRCPRNMCVRRRGRGESLPFI